MNNDEFIAELANKLDLDNKDAVEELVASLSDIISESLQNARKISLKEFGDLEVKKEKEHIVVNPSTQQRILIPPALNIYFRPDESLANKINVI